MALPAVLALRQREATQVLGASVCTEPENLGVMEESDD